MNKQATVTIPEAAGVLDTVTAKQRELLGVTKPPTLDSWQQGADVRWVFRHIDEMLPSAPVSQVVKARRSASIGLGVLDGVERLEERLLESQGDALVVEQGGRIVAEWYADGVHPDDTHLLMSVSKSLCAIVVGTLIDDGLVDPEARAEQYVPALAGSAYADATVQELLDMTAAANFSEDYTDPHSEVQAHDRAAAWRTPREGDAPDVYAFITELTRDREHGVEFQYCSAVTDTLGWIIEAVTGNRYADELSDRLWSRIGATHPARVSVDRAGNALANGGISSTARDLARVGRLMLGGGAIDGERVVSSAWVAQTLAGGDPAKALAASKREVFPGLSYRNQWWSTGDARGSVYGVGIHGQYLWLDPVSDTVIVRFSSLPRPVSLDDTRHNAALCADIIAALEG